MSIGSIKVYTPRSRYERAKNMYRLKGNLPLFYVVVTDVSSDGTIFVETSQTATVDEIIQTLCLLINNSNFVNKVCWKHFNRHSGYLFKAISITRKGIAIKVNYKNCHNPYEIKRIWQNLVQNNEKNKSA